ncbi:MAG: hypothetical protein WDZ59_07550 [Pirellulales bacterium]
MFRFTIGAAALATFLLIAPAHTQAQGLYIGPGGVGIGIGNAPRGYAYGYRNPQYNRYGLSPSRLYNYYGNRSYSPRSYRPYYYDNFTRGYSLGFGSGAAYPYWGPRTYWSGDRWWGYGIDLTPRYYYGYTPSYTYTRPTYDYDLDPYGLSTRSALTAPAREELTQLGWDDLRQVISNGADILRRELDEIGTGEAWADYLLLDQLNEAIIGDRLGPPDAEASEKLRDVLARFDAVAENPDYQRISDMAGFITVRRAVDDFLISPEDRYRRVLATTAAALEISLDDVATGARWHQYLGLDTLTGLHEDPAAPETLQESLARFDATTENEEYRTISGLTGFTATRQALADYVQFMSGEEEGAAPAEVEEDLLPPPPEATELEVPADVVPEQATPQDAAPADPTPATPPPQPQPAPDAQTPNVEAPGDAVPQQQS